MFFLHFSLASHTFVVHYYIHLLNLSILSFCLRPSAEDQGFAWVVVVLVLFHFSHFLFKRNWNEKIIPDRESYRGPIAPQPSTLSTELQQHYYINCCFFLSPPFFLSFSSNLAAKLFQRKRWHFWNDRIGSLLTLPALRHNYQKLVQKSEIRQSERKNETVK